MEYWCGMVWRCRGVMAMLGSRIVLEKYVMVVLCCGDMVWCVVAMVLG